MRITTHPSTIFSHFNLLLQLFDMITLKHCRYSGDPNCRKTAMKNVVIGIILLVFSFTTLSAAPNQNVADVRLQCKASKASFYEGEPCLIECTFSNLSKRPIAINFGLCGIQFFSFKKAGGPFEQNHRLPKSMEMMDAGRPRKVTLLPGHSYTMPIALNLWLTLTAGVTEVEASFNDPYSKHYAGSKFKLQIQKCELSELQRELLSDIRRWSAKPSSAIQIDFVHEIARAYASVRRTRLVWNQLSQNKSLSKEESLFANSVRAYARY